MNQIKYCKNSTISEAWAIVQGMPSPVTDESQREVQALIHSSNKKYSDLKAQPLVMIGQKKEGNVAPYWEFQGSWKDGSYIVRTGHNYLSVHRICSEQSKYNRYDTDVKPALSDWLDLQNATISEPAKRGVGVIGFGYINTFKFQIEGEFDFTKYLKVNAGLGVSNKDAALMQLKSSFAFYDKIKEIQFTVDAVIGSVPGVAGAYEIVTQVYCEKSLSGSVTLEDKEKIISINRDIQKYAKEMFFDITTEETRKLMEVVYD